MFNGIINIDKEKGYTSHDVVAKMRGILKMKKIGHTGTLDPDAEGVLPVCLGKGTKLVDLITDKDKTYIAELKLGVTTDTQDLSGQILTTREVNVNLEQLEASIEKYIGGYEQLPPMYSAIKVNGKKLYELARQGKEIERKRRRVQIDHIRILEYLEATHEVKIEVDCGKGTYIRTLLHDIGEELGCGGAMKSLIRTKVGSFTRDKALKLSDVEYHMKNGTLENYIMPVETMFLTYPKCVIAKEFDKLVYNGNAFQKEHLIEKKEPLAKELVRVYDSEEHFIGIYQFKEEKESYHPVKMFL